MAEDRMLSDEVLLALIKKNSGGGGTTDYSRLTNKPEINGVTLSGDKSASDLSLASLDANGKVPAAQLPSYVDDVINGYLYEGHFYEDAEHQTEITGESGKIYIDLETNKTYRWSGLAFVEISESLALGETASTAYAGDKGKENADAITAIKDGQTIDSFGDVESALANKVDKVEGKGLSTNDYTDADKTIVGGVTAALADKQDVLTAGNYVSITNNGTINVTQGIGVYDVYSYELVSTGVGITIQLTKKINNVTISTREIRNEDYSAENKLTVDGLFELWYDMSNFYWHYKLLVDSKEHQKNEDINWYYRTMADYTETFDVSQDSSTDLATKGDVNTAINAIKDGQSIDSFADVETALVNKQDKTDNSLQTTDKTVVGAINEHEGDIDSLKSGLTNYENQNNLNLEVPNRKNLCCVYI